MSRIRYLVGLQYRGTNFSGWSYQSPSPSLSLSSSSSSVRERGGEREKGRGIPMGIQYCLDQSLQRFLGEKYERESVRGSSRTDRGVHALRNTFQIDLYHEKLSKEWNIKQFISGLNSYLLKHEIYILDCREVGLDFDCRSNATSRTYMYRLFSTTANRGLSKQWLFQDDSVWNVRQLNLDAMREAAKHLIGIHDYTTFRNSGCQSLSTFRHIWRMDIDSHTCPGYAIKDPHLLGANELITITITGNAFLYKMVRNIVGTLVAVGKGKLSPDEIPHLLESRNRSLLPPMAPATGLYLVDVTYNEEDLCLKSSLPNTQ